MLYAVIADATKTTKLPVQALINSALVLIAQALDRADNPVVAWSAGKESQLLLALARRIRPNIQALYLRGFEHPTKHDFAARQAAALGLTVISPVPAATDVVAVGDHVELVETYLLQEHAVLSFPLEPDPDHVPGPDSFCAVEKINQPVSNHPLGVDCVFLGSRSDDVDPVHGPLALERDTVEANGCLFVFPLRNWTESDVWEASELMGVEQNKARYVEKDMAQNADYWNLCCECLKPGPGGAVVCPKVGDRVFRLGNYLNLEERREARERTFINLKRRDADV